MGAASYLIPVVAAQLTKASGEANAVYSLMIMLLVFAILAILSSLYLVAQHKENLRKECIVKNVMKDKRDVLFRMAADRQSLPLT